MRLSAALLSCVLVSSCLLGQTTQPPRAIAVKKASQRPVAQESRIALVIGNSTYTDAPLRNPANDAQAMKTALESCKFEVTLLTNASKRTMEDAIRTFGNRIRNGAVGLFYFAGHGIQVEGSNFLIPVGARLDKESDVPYEGVDVGRVLDSMKAAGNKLNILILDACRINPFALAKGWRSVGDKGLAQVKAPTGSLIAYATAPGSTAADGSGEHGLYTQALLEEIQEPGMKLEEVFKKVREKVLDGSKSGQTPWESNSTVGDFYFHPLSTHLTGPSEAELEATFWEGIQNSREAKEFDSYLSRFPNGAHAELARLKLKALRSAGNKVVVRNLAEPWKALQRDKLETKDEYVQRVLAMGPVKVGTVRVDVDNYDVDTRRLVLPVQPDSWAKSYVHQGRITLEIDRAQVRQLVAAGGGATLAASFAIRDGVPQSTGLIVSTSVGSFPVGEEPPPVPGAIRNPQGLWEADLDLGRCRMRMVLIPAGTFTMGTNATDQDWLKDSRPVHEVTISHDFWLGKYDVTQAQWVAVMGRNPSYFKGDDLPVETVSWTDAQGFIGTVNGATNGGFRLPTESEWEYACRAGTTGETYGNLDGIAWYDGNSGKTTHPVGQKQPNAFGLYDMNGNVWQWCQDWYGDYPSGSVTDPQGASSGSFRVIRGGSWINTAPNVRSANRRRDDPGIRYSDLGFRLLRTLP